jgi:uncharacterized membrane protein (UPF0127 family)
MRNYLLFIALLFCLTSAKASPPAICEDGLYQKIQFKKKDIHVCGKKISVEIADNESLRSVGLMCREKLGDGQGMLFIFERPTHASFWMKNTKIPLSIGFFSKDKKLINIDEMQPMDEVNLHESKKDALYALEMDTGWFAKNKIKTGCHLEP